MKKERTFPLPEVNLDFNPTKKAIETMFVEANPTEQNSVRNEIRRMNRMKGLGTEEVVVYQIKQIHKDLYTHRS